VLLELLELGFEVLEGSLVGFVLLLDVEEFLVEVLGEFLFVVGHEGDLLV
jgi:hypothetical protein